MSNEMLPDSVEKCVAPTIAGAALVGGGVAATTPPAKAQGPIGNASEVVSNMKPDGVRAHSIVNEVNAARADHGLNPVTENPALNNIAQDWADHLVGTGDLQHRPNHWETYPDSIPAGGENVLQAWDDFADAKLVNMWLNSPSHRKILLDPEAKTVGTGVAVGANGELFAVQNFGR